MVDPAIVFATTCKGRAQHIVQTLPKNLADNPRSRFVLLNYNSQDHLMQYIRDNHQADIKSGRLTVYTHLADGPFHLSHAKNMAARCGIMEGADILVTLDADNWTGPGFSQFIIERFREQVFPGIFLCPDFDLIHSLPFGPSRPKRGYAGRLAIKASDFVKLGGYDEVFNTWRGEDMDMLYRLKKLDYSERHIDNFYLNSIPHSTEIRFKEYPHAQQYENPESLEVVKARTEKVVNFGNFGVGIVYRNFDFDNPIELKPLPTRIFGIGMHKTGTTSLHTAFQILGFDSLHFGTTETARMWEEMNLLGRSKTIEQWYALSDLPIPMLYEKLDLAYPGSKFILTIRNEKDWLKSVEKLWSYSYNPTRRLWDIYPISNRLHNALYGQTHFESLRFQSVYRWHNESVREYFKDRPGDLLVMDMDNSYGEESMGWSSLCAFLNAPRPTVPYPCQNPSHKPEPPVTMGSCEPCAPNEVSVYEAIIPAVSDEQDVSTPIEIDDTEHVFPPGYFTPEQFYLRGRATTCNTATAPVVGYLSNSTTVTVENSLWDSLSCAPRPSGVLGVTAEDLARARSGVIWGFGAVVIGLALIILFIIWRMH